MLTPAEYVESISGVGATGSGCCTLNISIGGTDEDNSTDLELGTVIFSLVHIEDHVMIDLTFTDLVMLQRLYKYLEDYGLRLTMRAGKLDEEKIMYFQFAPDDDYWEQYLLAMCPQFWALTTDSFHETLNTIRLLFNEDDLLYADADDTGDDEDSDEADLLEDQQYYE